MDLEGNTFWEYRDRLNATRPRRMIEYKGGHTLANYQDFKVDGSLLPRSYLALLLSYMLKSAYNLFSTVASVAS